MSHEESRAAGPGVSLPPDLVHRVRNDLGVAIATADLLLLEQACGPQAVHDVKRIRDACIKAMDAINAAVAAA